MFKIERYCPKSDKRFWVRAQRSLKLDSFPAFSSKTYIELKSEIPRKAYFAHDISIQ